MENPNIRVTPGKRKRSDSCRSSTNEAGTSQKFARVDGAKFSKERFLKRRRSQTLLCRKRRNTINGQSFKFFYGGSIADPLNLNGLINRSEMSNTVTPISSPMITPMRGDVFLPIFQYANINDPLNLGGEYPDDFILNVKPKTKTRKRRYSFRKHNKPKEDNLTEQQNSSLNMSSNTEETKTVDGTVQVSDSEGTAQISNEQSDTKTDKNLTAPNTKHSEATSSKTKSRGRRPKQAPIIKHKTKNVLFKSGNYSSYVGYCNLKNCDARVDLVASEDLSNKSILDVGCNVGNVTIKIAREHGPKRIVGIDIDRHLIRVAKKNLSYFNNLSRTCQSDFPSSMKSLYGPLTCHPLINIDNQSFNSFPINIEFKVDNYVPLSNYEAKKQKPEFDVIMAFRVTKYIQLNHGDDGLKRTFIKMFNHLNPGGKLYLQAQDWESYKQKKKLTEEIFHVYKNINFLPSQFQDFLLSAEVGFSECHHVADIQLYNRPKGIKQNILKFIKPLPADPK